MNLATMTDNGARDRRRWSTPSAGSCPPRTWPTGPPATCSRVIRTERVEELRALAREAPAAAFRAAPTSSSSRRTAGRG